MFKKYPSLKNDYKRQFIEKIKNSCLDVGEVCEENIGKIMREMVSDVMSELSEDNPITINCLDKADKKKLTKFISDQSRTILFSVLNR